MRFPLVGLMLIIHEAFSVGVGSMRRVVVEDQVGVAASIYERHYEELKERQQLKNASALTNSISKSASI